MIVRIGLFLMLSASVSCNSDQSDNRHTATPVHVDKEQLIAANKAAEETEDRQIEDFIRRRGWKMKTTGTGLRYMIYKKGAGKKAETGKIAVIDYEVRLITGELIYTSEKEGAKEFLIGKGGVESGIEEAILLLHEGDRAKFILPSHLAFGLTGDQNKIPPKSTLIYDIKLLTLKDK